MPKKPPKMPMKDMKGGKPMPPWMMNDKPAVKGKKGKGKSKK